MVNRRPVLGILGGMGPEATVELMRRIVVRTPAKTDQEHIRCIVDQNGAVPNRTDAICGAGPSPGPVLADMAKRLTAYGATLLCMPCNTAHYYLDAIRAATDTPFMDMIECAAACARTRCPDATQAGVLCTVGTRHTRLYEKHLAAQGLTAVYPDAMGQEILTSVIARVKSGNTGADVRADCMRVMESLRAQGVPVLIAACTELSVIAPDTHQAPWLVDALDALVDAVIAWGRIIRHTMSPAHSPAPYDRQSVRVPDNRVRSQRHPRLQGS